MHEPDGRHLLPPHYLHESKTKTGKARHYDLALVRAELERHAHLSGYQVEAIKGPILVFQPHPRADTVKEMAERFGLSARLAQQRLAELRAHAHFAPITKFVPCALGEYEVHRMTHRGDGGWSWTLAHGALRKHTSQHVRGIGTDAFFHLL